MSAPVGTYFTPKLGLTVHGLDDELDAMRPNWDKLDTSYTGVIWVPPDTVPDTTILFEGALIAERGTGKVWRAQKNSSGIFEKKWIVYPWILSGDTSFTVGADFSANGEYGIITFNAAQSINAVSGDIVAGRMVTPINGVYMCVITHRFEPPAPNDLRYVQMMFNGTVNGETLNYDNFKTANQFNNYQSVHRMKFNRYYPAGTQICLAVKHSSGGSPTIACSTHFALTCVRPV